MYLNLPKRCASHAKLTSQKARASAPMRRRPSPFRTRSGPVPRPTSVRRRDHSPPELPKPKEGHSFRHFYSPPHAHARFLACTHYLFILSVRRTSMSVRNTEGPSKLPLIHTSKTRCACEQQHKRLTRRVRPWARHSSVCTSARSGPPSCPQGPEVRSFPRRDQRGRHRWISVGKHPKWTISLGIPFESNRNRYSQKHTPICTYDFPHTRHFRHAIFSSLASGLLREERWIRANAQSRT